MLPPAISIQRPVVRVLTGSETKAERAAVTVSCAKMFGSSTASSVKKMRPFPRWAMSFSKAASTSFSVPSPMTLTVPPLAVISSMRLL